jgi:imidazoleglycerol-phosphate dehydratase
MSDRPDRSARVERATNETQLVVGLDLDRRDPPANATGHGFLDHLLDQVGRHGRFALSVEGEGDLEVDVHHLAEDTGITLGTAMHRALGERRGIVRYGSAFVPMDESLAHVVLDLSGRPHLSFEPAGYEGSIHGFNAHHLRELLRGFVNHAGATLHLRILAGVETHHVCEAAIKAFARALHDATRLDGDDVPSTKGVL